MSFGLSVNDLRLAFELASFLYEKCFTRAQGADVQYNRFGREIESFAGNLQQLIRVTEQARPRSPLGNHADERPSTLQPLSQAAGDFHATLKECERLLNDRNRFQRNAAGFIDNVQWHMGTQRDVDILRERVHFHATKLVFLMKPFELHLLLEIRQELHELRREVAEIRDLLTNVLADGQLPDSSELAGLSVAFIDVNAGIEGRFLDATQRDAPLSFDGINMPLREGFDALVYQFVRSTVEFNPGPDLTQKVSDETQFVNLLKSKWIIDKLENSTHLRNLGSTSLWASYLQELKSTVIKEYRRFNRQELLAPPKEAIMRLPDQSFAIWATMSPPICPPALAEQRPLEDLILELELPGSFGSFKTFLSVFRRSSIEFRFVTNTKDLRNPGYHQQEDFVVNTNVMKVIPVHATPDTNADASNILLSNSQFQDLRWQSLGNASDVAVLQQALTGYRVHTSMSNVSWSFSGSSNPQKCGRGKLQLWQLQQLPRLISTGEDTDVPSGARVSGASSTGSPVVRRESTALSTVPTMFSGSSANSTVTGSRGDGTAVLMPEPPVMVIFTAIEDKYAFVYLELDQLTFVNPERCDCRKHPKRQCRVAVLETKSKSKYVKIRRLCSEESSGKGLYTWDLARFRTPRHPEFENVEVVPKVKYLRLDFQTVEEKDEFREELESLERVRSLDLKMYHQILEEKRRKERKPEKR